MIFARPAATSLPTSTSRIFSGSVSVQVSPVVPVTTMPSAPGGDDVVDVLLDAGPVDFAVGGERSDERDEHLAEGIGGVRHGSGYRAAAARRIDRPMPCRRATAMLMTVPNSGRWMQRPVLDEPRNIFTRSRRARIAFSTVGR